MATSLVYNKYNEKNQFLGDTSTNLCNMINHRTARHPVKKLEISIPLQ